MSLPGLDLMCASSSDGEPFELIDFHFQPLRLPGVFRHGRSRKLSEFQKLSTIKEGDSGILYQAKDLDKDEIVVLKKLTVSVEDFSFDWIHEINILNLVSHGNVIKLIEVVSGKALEKNYLALEYCPFSLGKIPLSEQNKMLPSQVKNIMFQLFTGLEYIHQKYIIHRNIHTSCILFDDKGILKIAGFKVARKSNVKTLPSYTTKVGFKAPELLFKMDFSFPIDIWAAACVFAELLKGKPLFPATDDEEMIKLVVAFLGKPTKENWPGLNPKILEDFKNRIQPFVGFNFSFLEYSPLYLSFLKKFFQYDPSNRITATQCLEHDYFKVTPPMCSNEDLVRVLHDFMKENKVSRGRNPHQC